MCDNVVRNIAAKRNVAVDQSIDESFVFENQLFYRKKLIERFDNNVITVAITSSQHPVCFGKDQERDEPRLFSRQCFDECLRLLKLTVIVRQNELRRTFVSIPITFDPLVIFGQVVHHRRIHVRNGRFRLSLTAQHAGQFG